MTGEINQRQTDKSIHYSNISGETILIEMRWTHLRIAQVGCFQMFDFDTSNSNSEVSK